MIAGLPEQQIEIHAGQIVGHRLHLRIPFLVKNLAIAVAFLAGFCAYGGLGGAAIVLTVRSQGRRLVGNGLARSAAAAALHSHHVPLGRAQRTMQIAITLVWRLRIYHACHRVAAAQRTKARNIERTDAIGGEGRRDCHPMHLQRRHDHGRNPCIDRLVSRLQKSVRLTLYPGARCTAKPRYHLGDARRKFAVRSQRPAQRL
jgi:hypothetical protein